MSNKVLGLSLPVLLRVFNGRGKQCHADATLRAAQEEATFQAYASKVWQHHAGMSVGGWGSPW